VRLNHVVHISDIFAAGNDAELSTRVRHFIEKTAQTDQLLVSNFACLPGPESLRL
jgi:hypothetical protein